MEKKIYISEEEQRKCQKVAEAFEELYDMENIVVLDVGRYGFVKLQYYHQPDGFENVVTYTDSNSMFEDLWQEWLDTKLFLIAKEKKLSGMGYEKIFAYLSEMEQKKLIDRKKDFAKNAELELIAAE